VNKVLALILAAVAIVACGRSRSPASIDIIARVDGDPVLLPAFRRYFVENAGRALTESSPRVVSELFDQFLREEFWRREAKLHGVDDELDRREAPGLLLAPKKASMVPSEADIASEYEGHADRYRRGEEATARRLVTRTREETEKARSRIVRGEDFGKVAREASTASDAARGGQMGTVSKGDLPLEFESAIFRLRPGETSPVLAAEEGYVVFQLMTRTPARVLPLDEARPEIVEKLSRDRARSYLGGLVERARAAGRIEVFAERLPFVYSGAFAAGRTGQ
jgi:hypothetical protein